MTKGQHKLTIENANGFNAINTFTVIPDSQFKTVLDAIADKTSKMNLIYLMDQADFNHDNNDNTSSTIPLFSTLSSPPTSPYISTFSSSSNMPTSRADNMDDTAIFNGTLDIPANVESVTLNFEGKFKSLSSDNNDQTTNPIRSIDLIPTSQKIVYSEDYENVSNPYVLFGDALSSALSNPDNPISNISISNANSITGNNSLRVDMKAMDKMNDSDDWSYIITNYIPIDDNSNLKFNSKVKTMNVIDFHPIVYYYDSNYIY